MSETSPHGPFLTGETAVVTGAGRGIGRAIARAFAGAGATVVLAARTEADLVRTQAEIAEIGGRAVVVPTDVTVRAEVERLIARALAETGRLDVLVNDAAVFIYKPFAQLDESEWDRVLDTNLKAVYLATRAALPALIESGRGRVINIGSIHGTIGDANVVAQCAAKFGLVGMSKALARELREVGVTVNVINPGATDNRARDAERKVHDAPLREKLHAEDVADSALFLASPAARTINGAVLDVWGGTHLAIKT